MQHRGAQYSWVARHMSEQLMIFPLLLVPSSSTLMKEHRQIQWPNLWCQKCTVLGCRGSSDDRSGFENQIMLQDWRLRGGYRYLGVISILRLYGKWRYSPERLCWLLTSIKVLLSILKSLAFGNIGIVVERQIDIESRKLLEARRVNAVTNCDSLRLVPNSSYAPPSTTSPLPGNREDWNI